MVGWILVLVFGLLTGILSGLVLLRTRRTQSDARLFWIALVLGLGVAAVAVGVLSYPPSTSRWAGLVAMFLLGFGLLYAAARPSSRLFRAIEMAWPGGQMGTLIGATTSGILWIALGVYIVLHG